MGHFFQIFVAFSEYLNFKSRKTYLQTVEDFEFEKNQGETKEV